MNIKQFDLWVANLHPGKGNIPGKVRPVVILQTNLLNNAGHPTTVICPLTSDMTKESKILRITISANALNGLEKDSAILADQIRTIENLKLLNCIGNLEEKYRSQLKKSILSILDLS